MYSCIQNNIFLYIHSSHVKCTRRASSSLYTIKWDLSSFLSQYIYSHIWRTMLFSTRINGGFRVLTGTFNYTNITMVFITGYKSNSRIIKLLYNISHFQFDLVLVYCVGYVTLYFVDLGDYVIHILVYLFTNSFGK